MVIEWDEEKMSTGLEEIDNQHKEWLNCLQDFEDAVVQGAGKQRICDMLDFLKEYTNMHFYAEEQAMEIMHSSALGENLAAHEEFRGKLVEIDDWVRKEGISSVEILELKSDLEEWLTQHICTVDIKLRDGVSKIL